MSKLKLAIQKKGRLSEKSLQLLGDCGIKIANGSSGLKTEAANFPIDILFLRDDDIPQYVEQQVADVGILGENEVLEQKKDVELVRKLGFARCRLSLAIPRDQEYPGLHFFQNKRIATSYPTLTQEFFRQKNIDATIEEISGSVEIAPGIGLAEAISDLVSTGSTLQTNGLKEVETILDSQAILISNKNIEKEKLKILERLLFRISAVQNANENKYILLNARNDSIENICRLLPGMKSPTILPLAQKGWSSLHSVVREDDFWEVIDELKKLGAEGILVIPIEKMIQ
jgi:ATP phosphoribosyltransferase